MNDTNSTQTTAPQGFSATWCQHRLPCGYCERLMRQCPQMPCTIEPTWGVSTNPNTGTVTVFRWLGEPYKEEQEDGTT